MESDNDVDEDLQCKPPLFQQNLESPQKSSDEPVVWWIVVFISLIRTLHKLPDRAVSWLIKFLCVLLHFLGRKCDRVAKIAQSLPQSLYLLNRYNTAKPASSNIVNYCVCRRCNSLHDYANCVDKVGSILRSKVCSRMIFRRRCDTPLLRQVMTSIGSQKLYPYKTYCYYSVLEGLKKLLLRPGISRLMSESTRVSGQKLRDISDGRLWNEFRYDDGKLFFDDRNNYGLMLNCDWFQPFKHYT